MGFLGVIILQYLVLLFFFILCNFLPQYSVYFSPNDASKVFLIHSFAIS